MRPLVSALPGALSELLRGAPLSPGKVAFAWRAAVGPALERETAIHLENGTLFVDARSKQWAHEVRRSSSLILSRLQRFLGDETVTAISVRERA